ncbi:hypothetical protein [Loktanella sp. SALINAS62]|uniref:hypothetical protein n=1 Tax=Loktanella sp. SALINAS62 TaxID=2706124 RepID=UPI001B8B3040|nr:hypothetical protein [Loktanella sp. SALINAS62]MBS1303402.1 hypothetical protein [Loktanella sp. SALINAS62]
MECVDRSRAQERLREALNRPRARLELEDERDTKKDREVEKERGIDRDTDRGYGLGD